MKTYLTHPSDNKLTNGVFYSDSDDYKKAIDYKNINEFQSLYHKDLLIYLIPSSLVSTYPFKENKKLSHQNNLAKFISEVDTNLVKDESKNKFFLINTIGYVIEKSVYEQLSESLSSLKCKVILLPDYFLNQKINEDSVTEFNSKILFAFSDGTGTSIEKESLDQYISFIETSSPEFDPTISIENNEKHQSLKNFKNNSSFALKNFLDNDLSILPNLYKFNFSIKNVIKKLNFNKFELITCCILVLSIISLPYILIVQNNNHTNIYKEETFNLFKKIDKNTNKVVTPKIQIDQLIKQVPSSYQPNNKESNFKNLDFLITIGDKFIDGVEINFKTNSATLTIKDMPQMQYNLIRGIANRFNISILDENISSLNKLNSGSIKIKFQ